MNTYENKLIRDALNTGVITDAVAEILRDGAAQDFLELVDAAARGNVNARPMLQEMKRARENGTMAELAQDLTQRWHNRSLSMSADCEYALRHGCAYARKQAMVDGVVVA